MIERYDLLRPDLRPFTACGKLIGPGETVYRPDYRTGLVEAHAVEGVAVLVNAPYLRSGDRLVRPGECWESEGRALAELRAYFERHLQTLAEARLEAEAGLGNVVARQMELGRAWPPGCDKEVGS